MEGCFLRHASPCTERKGGSEAGKEGRNFKHVK
jgi:hypothetical protein